MSYADIVRGAFGGDRFTIISNLAARDRRLSYRARGLLTAIGSHREGWGITAEKLAKDSPDGIAAVRSGLKELEACGYLRRYRVRDELGRLGGARWVITDDPDSIDARVAELAQEIGEQGMDLFQRQNPRSEPTCDSPTLAEPTVAEPTEADRTPKKTSHKNTSVEEQGREEEGAQARASESDTNGEWGIPDRPRPAADTGTLFARSVISGIAEETGLGLEPWQHRRLVLEHLPAALDAVHALGDDAISGTELVEWLRADHDTSMSLYAVLSTRCRPDYLREALPVWVARTRTPGGLAAPSKPAPRPRNAEPDPEPFTAGWNPTMCAAHPAVALTADATGRLTRCHRCEDIPAPEAPAETPDPSPEDLADAIGAAMGTTGEPELPPHCGARNCLPTTRHIVCPTPDGTDFEDLGPCPRCHPDHATERAA